MQIILPEVEKEPTKDPSCAPWGLRENSRMNYLLPPPLLLRNSWSSFDCIFQTGKQHSENLCFVCLWKLSHKLKNREGESFSWGESSSLHRGVGLEETVPYLKNFCEFVFPTNMETSRLTANMKQNMQNNAYANKTSLGILEGGCCDLSLFAASFLL